MICPNCGKELADNTKFCGSCGTTIVEKEAQESFKNDEKSIKDVIMKNKLYLIVPIALIIILLIIVGTKIFSKKDNKFSDNPTYSTSFFLKDKDGKYALFNKDGKNITGFIFKRAETFYNGYALVINDKDEYGIISTNGSMGVKFGKYPLINGYKGLYVVPNDDGEYKYKLITSTDNLLEKMQDINISALSYSSDSIISIDTEKNYIIYNISGKKIVSFKKNNKADKVKINTAANYGVIYYNGENVIFNDKQGSIVSKFKDKNRYCINSVSDDKKTIILNTCNDNESVSDRKYKVLVNGKTVKVDKSCNQLSITNQLLTCKKDGKDYLLTKDYKIGSEYKVYSTAMIDSKNYLVRESDGYSFYKNNKMVKHLTSILSIDTGLETKYFRVKERDYLYYYYNLNGEKAIKKGFKVVGSFDDNGVAIVGDDYYTYYLINSKGKTLTKDSYYTIKRIGKTDKYIVSIKDGSDRKYGVIDSKGKIVIDVKYYRIQSDNAYDKYYVYCETAEDGDYELYTVDKIKLIGTYSKKPYITNQYYYISDGDTITYYTLDGKKFYSR